METALSLGAWRAIDYRKTDFSRERRTYDLILAVNCYHSGARSTGSTGESRWVGCDIRDVT